MKRELLILILTFFIFAQISALEIKTEKEDFMKGETFIATITGNILENIEKSDISFLKEHVEIPLTFDLIKVNNTYYIYALLKYQEQNFTLRIEDIYYKEQNQFKTSTLEKTFQVINQTAPFQISPGFTSTFQDFKVSVYNNLDNDISLEYKINNKSEYTAIPLQDSRILNLKIESSSINPNIISFSAEDYTYLFPLNFLGSLNSEDNNTYDDNESCCDVELIEAFRIFSDDIIARFNINEKLLYPIKIKNTGDTNISLNLSVSENLRNFITVSETAFELPYGMEKEVNLTMLFNKTGDYDGFFTAEYKGIKDSIYLELTIGENVTVSSSVKNKDTCETLGGKKCTICYGSSIPASDGLCCLGSCDKPESETERNWIVIIIIIVILLIIGAFVFFKMRKPEPTARDILRRKTAI